MIRFTKMHGAGNDYIYVNTMLYDIPRPEIAAIAWSDRHKGIGSDGLVLIGAATTTDADFSMRIFNADGSEAMMCGNASRCIGKYLYERRLTQKTTIRLQTLSGIKTLLLHVAGDKVESVTVDMLEPVLENMEQYVPSLNTQDSSLPEGVFVSMGNPHFVIFTDDIDQVGSLGRHLEHHPAFPQRCNIELARIEPDGSIRTRVWERGSGITMACGTGACASKTDGISPHKRLPVAAAVTGRASRQSAIVMDGGTLGIEWNAADNHVYMTGPAEFVFDGEISDEL